MILGDKEHLPGLLGIDVVEAASGRLVAKLKVAKKHMALNGCLHAGSIITLTDSSAGYGCLANLPEGALGFTTVELKCNLMGTVTQGEVVCIAACLHAGRTTQVWECEVRSEASKLLVKSACTQLILYAK